MSVADNADNVTSATQVIAATVGVTNLTFVNMDCDGQDGVAISAQFWDDDLGAPITNTCAATRTYNEPCWLDIQVNIVDECRDNGTYTVEVTGTYYNAPGNMTVSITGNGGGAFSPASNTVTLSALADGEGVAITSFTKDCDGQLHDVSATFAANNACSDMESFEGPRDRDYGDNPDGFDTNFASGGAFHIIHDDIFLGACVDSELDGAPETQAGVDGTPQAGAGAGGDDATGVQFETGELSYHECVDDDEDGVQFLTPMVQGNEACVQVTATSTLGAATLDMWVDFNGDGTFQAGEKVAFTSNVVPVGTSTQQYCFTVPATATFPNQETHVRVRLSTAGVANPTGIAFDGEVEDYYLQFAKIGDFVWEDLDIDGEQDNGEPGIVGADVTISGFDILGNAYTATVQTTTGGMYMFNGLLPGDYTVTFGTPTDFFPTKQDELPGNDDDDSDADPTTGVASSTPVTLAGGDIVDDVDAGFWTYASIGDYVWKDQDADGFQDPLEPGINGVTVELTGTDFYGNPVNLTTTTTNFMGMDGYYIFDDLVPGVYKLTFTTPAGLYTTYVNNLPTNDADDSDADPAMGGMTVDETLLSGENNPDYDAGYFEPVALGNVVWLDENADGVQDNVGMPGGEVPIENATVTLFQADGVTSVTDADGLAVDPVTTGSDGMYMFMNLIPGDYVVQVTPPAPADGNPYLTSPSGGDPDNNIDTDSNGDPIPGGAQSLPVTLTSNGEINDGDADDNKNPSVDFGFYQAVSVGDLVWIDSDNDGIQDNIGTDEQPLLGALVELFEADGTTPATDINGAPVASVTTGADGMYMFMNLIPGDYVVQVTPPAGLNYLPTVSGGDPDNNDNTDSNGEAVGGNIQSQPVTLISNAEINDGDTNDDKNPSVDFGFFQALSLGDLVWIDSNYNGLQDNVGTDEQPVSGALVELFEADGITPATDVNGAPVASVTTGADGMYMFMGLAPGDYVVQVTPPAGFNYLPTISGGDPDNDDNTDSNGEDVGGNIQSLPITLSVDGEINDGDADDNKNPSVDFGFFEPVSLGDIVWIDEDADGTQDAGEDPLPGAVVSLFEADGVTPVTDVNGNPVGPVTVGTDGMYMFMGLYPGDYVVQVVAPTDANPYIASPSGGDPDNDDNTDSNGENVGGNVQSLPITLSTDGEVNDGDADNDKNPSVDFGFYQAVSLGDIVWLDENADGIQDNVGMPGGEVPIAGAIVELFEADGTTPATDVNGAPVASVTTGTDGMYMFMNLIPGDYVVKVTTPTPADGNPYLTSPSGGDPDNNVDTDSNGEPIAGGAQSLPVTLTTNGEINDGDADDDKNPSVDFGFYQAVSVGDLVWIDSDNDGIQDNIGTDEQPLAGALVELFEADGTTPATDIDGNPVASVTTGTDGMYMFMNLIPGDYVVQVTPPAGLNYLPTVSGGDPDNNDNTDSNGEDVGGNIQSQPVTLVSNAEINDGDTNDDKNPSVDFGFFQALSLGDLVWIDSNYNGLQDNVGTDEQPVSGAVVELFEADGTTPATDVNGAPVASVTTGANGMYMFMGLAPGDYVVQVTPPAGFNYLPTISGGDPDNDDNTDSNGEDVGGNIQSQAVTLSTNGEINDGDADDNKNPSVDFGFFEPVSLGDIVWIDEDADGIQDAGEDPLPGAVVSLFEGDGVTPVTDVNGNPVGPVTVGADGMYMFMGLYPGDYVVQVVAPTDANPYIASPSGGDPDNDDNTDSNGEDVAGNIQSQPITLSTDGEINDGDADNDKNPSVDFGFYQAVSLGDVVWLDENADGIQDNVGMPGGEVPIAGATVELFEADGTTPATDVNGAPVTSVTTGTDGMYMFMNLIPGDYVVKVTTPTPADGNPYLTSPSGGDPDNDDNTDSNGEPIAGGAQSLPVTLTTNGEINDGDADDDKNPSVDFGFYQAVSVGDLVWIDSDSDGIQDNIGTDEQPLEGALVELFEADGTTPATDINGAPVASVTTGTDGMYMFMNLIPGDYVVRVTPPAPAEGSPYIASPSGGDPDNNDDTDSNGEDVAGNIQSQPITLISNDENNDGDANNDKNPSVDFGFFQTVALGDLVWFDLDTDGIQDNVGQPGGEEPIQGAVVSLFEADGTTPATDATGAPVASVTTGADGMYMFMGLLPGDYVVQVAAPSVLFLVSPDGGDPDNNDNTDSNGIEVGAVVQSLPVTLTVDGENNDGDADNDKNPSVDFGFYQVMSLGDIVWIDNNGNGLQDNVGQPGGELPIAGAIVELFEADGTTPVTDADGNPVTSVTTGPDGMYMFMNLIPGDYVVQVTPPDPEMVPTFDNGDPDNDDNTDSNGQDMAGNVQSQPITLMPGEEVGDGDADDNKNSTVDFGFYIPASIGDVVWIDTDGDGIQDDPMIEPGLPGVKVTLTGNAGNGSPVKDPNDPTMDRMVTTGPDGSYLFDGLPPGTYKLTFMAPNGSQYVLTYYNEGDDPNDNVEATNDSDADPDMGGMTETTVLESDEDDLDWDAGFYEPASIGDYVWDDQNNNGQQDPGELPIEGVKVTLTGTTGNGTTVLDPATGMEFMTFTEPDGSYIFDALVPGDYKLTFDTPADLNPTKDNEPGVDDADDSDADPVTGMTEFTFLESGEYDPTWDAGFFAVDFGDLPDSYGTTDAASGPKHIIIPQLYLGSCVDAETDGQDEAMAGLMDNGDDNNASAYGQPGSTGCADDEDGITFITPVIPGYEACIEIDVVNTTGAPAVLQGWLDFDGNGVMDDPADELNTGDFAGGGVTVPAGGLTDEVVCFDIPADAMYVMGDGFMRFRLSPDGGLQATGVNPDGTLPAGEVEDYKLPDVKIGNLIWEDRNYNGIQDPGIDDGINGIEVQLMWAGPNGTFGDGDDETYVTVSAPVTYVGMGPGGSDLVKDGIYYFEGLTPGNYKITVVTNRFATLQDVGGNVGDADLYDSDNENGEFFTILPEDITNQILGEDGLYDMPGMTNAENPDNSYPDAQDNLSFDFGYVGFDRGDLPDSFVTKEDSGMPGMEGPRHLATPFWYMGACVDVDLDGQPDYTAGYYDALDPNNPEPAEEGDDNLLGVVTLPVGVNCGDDDENGVILTTSMVPGYEACFDVNTTAPEAGVMQAWIDFDGSLDFNSDGSEAVVWTKVDGTTLPVPTTEAVIAAGAGVTTELCFMVPDNAVMFPNLETHMRFRFSDQGGLDSKNPYANGDFPFGEVEDYYQPLAELGDYVWHDVNGNGVQDDGEAPVEGVTVELHDCTDPDNPQIIATTTTDAQDSTNSSD